MPGSYLSGVASTRKTSQREAIAGREQVENNAGGFVFKLEPLDQVRRFLIIGAAGGSYYAGERGLARENADVLRRAFDEYGEKVVDLIVEVSEAGRAPKNDEAIFALAMAIAHSDVAVRRAAAAAVPRVCRTGTHLFMFVGFAEEFRGWGRAMKRAVASWYSRPPEPAAKVAYQAVKYRQRGGWSHGNLLQLAHPTPPTPEYDALYRWILGKAERPVEAQSRWRNAASQFRRLVAPRSISEIEAFEEAQAATTSVRTAELVRRYRGKLPREALRTDHLQAVVVNEALLEAGMPMTALLRNLANLTRYGVLRPMGEWSQRVAAQITDGDRLRKARVHPFSVLVALAQYRTGCGRRGVTWEPVREIVDALDAAFYMAFGNVERTEKRTMLALDVSASMGWAQSMVGRSQRNPEGLALTARQAAAAMALVQANVGDPYVAVTFSKGWEYPPARVRLPGAYGGYGGRVTSVYRGIASYDLSPRQRLDDAISELERRSQEAGGTDCALPMIYALEERIEVDTFVIYTDNETWAGEIHPTQALEQYRQQMGIDAKLVVVGMTSTGFTIADPTDPKGQLDVVGFDTATPAIISEFSAGRL